MPIGRRAALLLPALAAFGAPRAQAVGPVRLGLLHTLSPAPFYLAQAHGAWAAEGVAVEFRFFDAAQPIAEAAVAGDIDLGVTGLTAGFFSLAGRGALKVIGGGLHEQKGFGLTALLVSNRAYNAGLTDLRKLPGHSFGVTQPGSSFHCMLGRLAQARGFAFNSVTVRPLQTVSNMLAAVRSGEVDSIMAVASVARPLIEAGEVKLLAWVGEAVPCQVTALFARRAMLMPARADVLRRFCRGYQKGVAEYRQAFLRVGSDFKPVHGPATEAAIAAIKPYVFPGDPKAAERIRDGAGWYDEGAALDVIDVVRQLDWFISQKLVKGRIDANDIIDTRFLPTR
ncbi:ABC transporter substrate-binding protein [Rhodovastum atsumiense]|nr:ABC transporter substrate-binding protein [Rhodovastum atsumiense]CAH2598626.1 ABC transporter substrate-binding protein [Rhodovastum atsumiense]